jgi:rfaE bifunctional protein kinase chain/domain
MKITLPEYENAQVLVVGDVMLDRYWHGPTGRISPEAPVPVVKVEEIEERPGGAANVALNVAALGGQATLIGLVGDDEPATALANSLKSVHVVTDFVVLPNFPTITKLRVLSRHQQLLRLDFEAKSVNKHSDCCPPLSLLAIESAGLSEYRFFLLTLKTFATAPKILIIALTISIT